MIKPGARLEDVLARYTPRLVAIPGVVGTAQSEWNGAPCVVVYVETTGESVASSIGVAGYRVDIREVGTIGPLQ